ncbi:MAG: ribonuclease HI family protein [Candidatus Micrarchaeota archaeon]|nr:ribonuclease HI family protein [Candidatus Micrarchaeota archaeon]MDE1848055.1 ribonuclease HI family protein [Candidatus Micrarchaeota archaeon]MDE1864627.1 ribonuclease HI family protein [Candidatus Micrarchaeota archaeon]
MRFHIYTDGAARGNPGESASGYVIFDRRKRLVARRFFYNGIATNNVAEYLAIVAALKKVSEEIGESEAIVVSDSELVVNQLKGNYKVKDSKLKPLYNQAIVLAKSLKKCEFANEPRENMYISMVDKALNELLDNKDHDEQRHGSQRRL